MSNKFKMADAFKMIGKILVLYWCALQNNVIYLLTSSSKR